MERDIVDIHNNIKSLIRAQHKCECTGIRLPEYPGVNKSVFLADTQCDGTYVFKLTCAPLALKNEAISKLLTSGGLPVPDIRVMYTEKYVFETYQMIPGQTLYEKIKAGECSKSQITNAYREMIRIQAKMEHVGASAGVPKMPMIDCHDIARANIAGTNNYLFALLFSTWVRCANIGSRRDLCLSNFDLNQKNVLVNSTNSVVGVIDIDTIGLCNRHFSLAMMLEKYARLGYAVDELLDYYEHIMQVKLNRVRIKSMLSLIGGGKKMLWWHANNKSR